MPLITRTFLKTGLIYFILALATGILLQIDSLTIPAYMPMFWHMLTVGWITQIIIAISLWMFPGRQKEESFRAQKWPWLTYGFLNVGLLLRFISEPMLSYSDASYWKVLLTLSAILQFLAVLSYVIEIWPRVFSRKQRKRKKA